MTVAPEEQEVERLGEAAREAVPKPPPNESHDWDEAARSTYQRLREKADADTPEAWMPTEPGDELMGTLVNVNIAAPTKFGSAPVCTIMTPEGPKSLWLLHAVLRREFERAKPAIGETLLVRYIGRVQPEGGGNAYEVYSLTLDREKEAAPSWDEIAARYGDREALDPEPADTAVTHKAVCSECGYAHPEHAVGCPEDIPF